VVKIATFAKPETVICHPKKHNNMEANLFLSLRKYRPRDNRDSLENFITEAFAWILNSYPGFSEHYLNYLSKELDYSISDLANKWETQSNFYGFFPDLVYKFGANALVFEHKVNSQLHTNQIDNYRNYSKENFEDYRIILLTSNTSQHSQSPDYAFCWNQIHALILEWLSKNSTSENLFIFNNFISLLEFEGLGPKAPISLLPVLLPTRLPLTSSHPDLPSCVISSQNSSLCSLTINSNVYFFIF